MANLFKCLPIALHLSLPVLLKPSSDKTTEMHVYICQRSKPIKTSQHADMPTCRQTTQPQGTAARCCFHLPIQRLRLCTLQTQTR